LNASSAEGGPEQGLERRVTGDGSPTLISSAFGEAFHSLCGALREAEWKFVAPAELHGVPCGSQLRVLDVCVGLGYNSACLIESADAVGLTTHWRGLGSDPRPLALALDDAASEACGRRGSSNASSPCGTGAAGAMGMERDSCCWEMHARRFSG